MNFIHVFASISKIIEKSLMSQRKLIQKALLILSFSSLFLILFPATIKETGNIAIWMLWFLLWLPILLKVFGLSLAGKLMIFRKEIGILMGVMAFIHSAQYFIEPNAYMFWEKTFWFQDGILSYLGLGMVATIITIILTLTSNIWSIKKLGKSWKRLHRTVYVVLIFSLLHVAFIHIERSPNVLLTSITALAPFFVYFTFKILEWKKIKLDIFDKKTLKYLILGIVCTFGLQGAMIFYLESVPPKIEQTIQEVDPESIGTPDEILIEPVEALNDNDEVTLEIEPETILEGVRGGF